MPRPIPPCKNETCPTYRSNSAVIVLQERKEDVTFGCKNCGGVEVRILDPRRGQQELEYQRYGRPEYARNRAYFFQGSRSK
jgi:hypothetical protein